MILICKCAYFIGHTSWELNNHEDARIYLDSALQLARRWGEEPNGYCLPHRSIAITCNRLSLLAEDDKDLEKVAQYAWLSYEQWKQAAMESQEALDWEHLAIVCGRIAMGQFNAGMAWEVYSIWDELARRFPDNPKYAEERERDKRIWEIIKKHHPGS